MNDVINYDDNIEYCSINTERWLEAVLGDEIELTETFDDWICKVQFDLEAFISNCEDTRYQMVGNVDNVCNYENDFDQVFQYAIFTKQGDGDDWYYKDDVYVAIEVHRGGDVRGNYGRTRLYKVDQLAETGFLDWALGFHICNHDTNEVHPESEQCSVGYSSWPMGQLREVVGDLETLKYAGDGDIFYQWGDWRVYPDVRIGY